MNSINPEVSFKFFTDSLVPMFPNSLLKGKRVDMSNRYEIPPRMMAKGSTYSHAHALPLSFPLDSPALMSASVNEQWMLFLKLANLTRSLSGNKSCNNVSMAFYYLLKSLPYFKMPWEIVNSDFIRASNQEGLTASQRYRVGAGLSFIGKLYNKYELSSQCIRYTQNPHVRPERSSKSLLPNLESCRLLADGFKAPKNTFETLVTSAFALLNYAPSRASEIVTLDVNCVTDLDGFGLRFPSPAKNGAAVVKRAPCTEFEQIVRIAVDRLLANSKTVREVAAWYESNPNELYIPANCESLRNKSTFTGAEALAILGYCRSDGLVSANLYKHRKNSRLVYFMPPGLSRLFDGFTLSKGDDIKVPVSDRAFISRDRLLSWIKDHLCSTFPYVDGVSRVAFKNSIFVYPFSSLFPVTKIFWKCEYVPCFFSSTKLQMHFSRLFFRSVGREDLSLGTHMMRHLLNTLAQTKHVDQRIIAMWSGRSSVEQNSEYDHRSMEEKTEAVNPDLTSKNYRFGGFLNDLYNAEHQSRGVSTEQFFQEVVGSLHVTELGYCRHDYASGPCPNVFQCIDCPEHCFTKSDRGRAAAVKMIDKLTPVLELASAAAANHEPGAGQFLEVHQRKLSRYKKQLEICQSDDVPVDALCALSPIVSHDNLLSKSLRWRASQADELTKAAHKRGRASGFSDATTQKIRSLPDLWRVEVHGLPTWKAICDFLESSCGLAIRRGMLLSDNECRVVLEELAARLLKSPLVKRDKSLRWYWNYDYLTEEVLKSWSYANLHAPTYIKVATEINRIYPVVNATKNSIEKNKTSVELIAKWTQELKARGYLYLSKRNRILSERAPVVDSQEGLQFYTAFCHLCSQWDLADGLPGKKAFLSVFHKKFGFDLTVDQLNNNEQLLSCFRTIKVALSSSRVVKYDAVNRPAWNVLCMIDMFSVDADRVNHCSLYEDIRARFNGFQMSRSAFAQYVLRYLDGERG